MEQALTMVVVAGSMVAVGILAWKLLHRQEAGDAAFEEKLRRDDERAEDGRRRRLGLPPLPRDSQGSGAPPQA